jgi:hypothetical protein
VNYEEEKRTPGESVREMLAQRSTEKAMANFGREDARADREDSALSRFLAEKKRKRGRPWK